MPGFSDLGSLRLCSHGFLVPPRLRGLPLRLCSVADRCQLVGEPVLLARPLPLDLGLHSESQDRELLSDSASSALASLQLSSNTVLHARIHHELKDSVLPLPTGKH